MAVVPGSVATAIAAALAAFAYWYVHHSVGWRSFAHTGNGYAAKLACGAVFGADRSLRSVLDAELVFPPAKYGRRFEVDDERRCITVFGTWPTDRRGRHHTTACWRGHRLGCHITEIDGASTAPGPLFPVPPELALDDTAAAAAARASSSPAAWPLGDNTGPSLGPAVLARGRVDLEALEKHVALHFADARLHARAVILVVDGQIVFERYGDGCVRHFPAQFPPF